MSWSKVNESKKQKAMSFVDEVSAGIETVDHSDLDRKILMAVAVVRGPNSAPITLNELAEAINEDRRVIQLRLFELRREGRVERAESGDEVGYSIPNPAKPGQNATDEKLPPKTASKVLDDDEISTEPERPLSLYATLEEKVFAAVDAKKRTLPQIKEHAGFAKSFDTSDLITSMVEDRKLRSENNGLITAYFRWENKPTKFWVTGDRTVDADFDEEFVPRDEEKKARELAGYGTADDAGEKSAADTAKGGKKSGRGRPAMEIDPERLEELAAKLANAGAIAAAIGMSPAGLYTRLKGDEKLRRRFDAGRRRFADARQPEKLEKDGPTNVEPKAPEKPMRIENESATYESASVEGPVSDSVAHSNSTSAEGPDIPGMSGEESAPELNPAPRDLSAKPAASFSQKFYLDATLVERAAEIHGTKRATAKALGFSDMSGLRDRMAREPALLAAFERGSLKFTEKLRQDSRERISQTLDLDSAEVPKIAEIDVEEPPRAETEETPEIVANRGRKPYSSNIDVHSVQELAARHGTKKGVARALGYADHTGFAARMRSSPDLLAAYERGIDEFTRIHAGSSLEQKSDITMDLSREDIRRSRVATSVIAVNPVNRSSATVNLTAGRIDIAFDGNFFELSHEDRTLMNDIADLLQARRAGK